jgi:hypothetical protein
LSPSVISGTVIDARGQPVGGARVFIAEAPVPVPDIAALTGENGRFTLTAPAPGRYVVSCAGREGETSSEEVNLRGDAADVILRIA